MRASVIRMLEDAVAYNLAIERGIFKRGEGRQDTTENGNIILRDWRDRPEVIALRKTEDFKNEVEKATAERYQNFEKHLEQLREEMETEKQTKKTKKAKT